MKKLLVNTPQGNQEIVIVGEGGGYFDESLVLWDERTDGEMPEVTLNGMEKNEIGEMVFNQVKLDSFKPKPEPKKELTGRELIESLSKDELIKLVDFLQLQNVLTDKRATKIKGGA